MIFAILTHCPNTKDINNYFARTPGRWFCLGAMLKGRPLAPIDYFSENPQGSNPRLVSEAPPSSFHQSLMALVLTTLRFAKMSRGPRQVARNCLIYIICLVIFENRVSKRSTYCLRSSIRAGIKSISTHDRLQISTLRPIF